mgnify:CR=1 FL=1
MLFLALSPTVEAGYVVSVGDPIEMNPWGTFHRTAPNGEDGWLYMIGTGGNWYVVETDNQHQSTVQGDYVVPDFDLMVDRGLASCPNGDWLLAGSGNLEAHNDTLWVWRLDADWNVIGESTLLEAANGVATNDMAVICSSFFSGVGVVDMEGGGHGTVQVYEVDDQAQFVQTHDLGQGLPNVQGSGWAVNEADQQLIMVGADIFSGSGLTFTVFDGDMNVVASHAAEVATSPSNATVYWPQGLMRAGDLYVVAHLAYDPADLEGEPPGNVYLQFYDQDFQLLGGEQVSFYEPPEAASRPGFARRGEQMVVTWDAQNVPYLVDVELDLTGANLPGDSAEPNASDDPSDPADDSGEGGGGGCGGCSSAGGGLALLWWAGLLGVTRRRL